VISIPWSSKSEEGVFRRNERGGGDTNQKELAIRYYGKGEYYEPARERNPRKSSYASIKGIGPYEGGSSRKRAEKVHKEGITIRIR